MYLVASERGAGEEFGDDLLKKEEPRGMRGMRGKRMEECILKSSSGISNAKFHQPLSEQGLPRAELNKTYS